MASYQGHLTFSSVLGAGYGGMAVMSLGMDWGPACLGAGLTAVGGMLPDLDSDSGIPVRELFGLAAALTPILVFPRLLGLQFTLEQSLALLCGLYLLIRYGASSFFKHLTVHRGMFHSIPALLISGLAVFLLYHSPDYRLRIYLAGAVMLGFLSHLVLDEIYGIDLLGNRVKPGKLAGSPLKLASSSWAATLTAYGILAALGWLAWTQMGGKWPISLEKSQADAAPAPPSALASPPPSR